MPATVDFYFDFSSPYGYLASQRIEAVAKEAGCTVNWHPILLGFIFKVSKQAPLTTFPLKGEYSLMDMERSARLHNIPYSKPEPFPVGTVSAARAFYWLNDQDSEMATRFIHSVFKAYYVDSIDISDKAKVIEIASTNGVDSNKLAEALDDDKVKSKLKTAVDNAIERGIFGSPTVMVDGEMFWGHDRLEQVGQWLATGGW